VSETAPGHAEDQPQISNPPTPTNGTSPALTRLIEHAFSPHELISLIGEVFSNEDDVMMIGYLHGNDTQTFIDVVYKVRFYPSFLSRGLMTPTLGSFVGTFAFRQLGFGSP